MTGFLRALGIDDGKDRVLLIEPPDAVLAEAAAIVPRPAVASSLHVARPASRIVWWPEEEALDPALLSRLRWLLAAAAGELWVVATPDSGLDGDVLCERLAAAGFSVDRPRAVGGSQAVRATVR